MLMMERILLPALFVYVGGAVTCAQIPVQDNARILFVGNSFTNNGGGLDNFVEQALADGPNPITVTAERNISFGKDLNYIWHESDAVSSIVNDGWDIVVVQGYWSGIDYPAGMLDTFTIYVDKFDSVITESGAKTVLLMPWTGNPTADWMSWAKYDNDSETFRVNYRAAGERTGAPVAPCGWIWHDLVRTKPVDGLPDDFLYSDAIHPNQLAQYLNSYIFYALLTHRSPVGLDYHYEDVTNVTFDEALRTAMQERVWTMMQEWLPEVSVGAPRGGMLRIPQQTSASRGHFGLEPLDLLGRVLPARARPLAHSLYVQDGTRLLRTSAAR